MARWTCALTLLASLLSAFRADTEFLEDHKETGKEFLEENKDREGVIALPSGLQYKVLKKGSGKYAPAPDSNCSCHYAGTTPSLTPSAVYKKEKDWNEFDSSYKRGKPSTFAPDQVVKGWTEAMQLMVEGDKWELYIPSDLGYGDSGSGDKIKGGDVLIFRLEILKIEGKQVRIKKCNFDTKKNCEENEIALFESWSMRPLHEVEVEIDSIRKKVEEKRAEGVLTKSMQYIVESPLPGLKAVRKLKKQLPTIKRDGLEL